MPHFVIFCDDRLDGVQRYLDRYNLTDNTLELCVGEDLTTQELGGRAFSWDEEVGLYLPLFSSAEAAIAAYGQWFDGIIINLLAHPAPSRIIITDLVGFDSVFWEHTPGDTVMQDWVDQVVVGVRGEADRINGWMESPVVPLGSQVHLTRRTVDGLLHVHDYRTFYNGFLPGRRQLKRWARVFGNLLALFVDGLYHN